MKMCRLHVRPGNRSNRRAKLLFVLALLLRRRHQRRADACG